ncbi:MAG: isochorismatase family protein [Rhodoferax sp.]|uniref:isochorismatase family protein n=1 Tax=Rhodoferax sp. TaxID=50421 RepID=UPI0013FF4FD3|nr:isochorismatase family protein [Rhodoferax sp.]NDP39808.1 isochorismatase family protein [Rhodoferax sp.]
MSSHTHPISLQVGDALLIVDVQSDFLAGGSLAAPQSDEVIPVLNGYLAAFQQAGLPVLATRDWHPSDHCSFRPQGGPWPPHCVAGSAGANFASGLKLPVDVIVISKATDRQRDAYSGFEDTELDPLLRKAGVSRLFIGGLATDYCVLHTVRDALKLGYQTLLLQDAVRAVDVQPGDGERAVADMLKQGARAVTLNHIGAISP